MTRSTADVVIAGGGVVGSSVAYHLRKDGVSGRIVVVERDPTYARASSSLAMGGIRQQFSSEVNVRMTQWSIRFYEQFDAAMSAGGHAARAQFRQRGYLFLVDAPNVERFEKRLALQQRLGARVERLGVEEVRRLVPDLFLDDVAFGVIGRDDGYANPKEVLRGFRAAAEAAGAEYATAEIVGVRRDDARVLGVTLGDGSTIATPVLVNAAGPFAARLGALAGLELPVAPVRQHLFRCELPRHWPYRFPMVIDPGGVHWRHQDPLDDSEPDRIIVARTRRDEPAGENFACDASLWERWFLPDLARRMPAFAGLKPVEGWAGLYEMTPDHNPILGEHPGLRGFFVANGFSGHGLMQAPATGKVLSELIRLGRAETVDVRVFAPDRFERGAPFHDEAMI